MKVNETPIDFEEENQASLRYQASNLPGERGKEARKKRKKRLDEE